MHCSINFQRWYKRETFELAILPAVLAAVVSISLSFSVKCLLLPGVTASESPLATLTYMIPIVLVSFALSLKTRGWIRYAVLLQLSAVSLLVIMGLSAVKPGMFADVFSAVLCGGIAGALITFFRLQKLQLQTQRSEIDLRRKQLLDAKLALVKHDEVERRLLAADLHDQVLHDLKMVRQTLNGCRTQLDGATAERLQSDVSHCMSAVREVMDSLFPSSLEHLGVVGAIEECLDHAGRRGGFETFVRSKVAQEELEQLNRVEALLLFRLIQEAVNNITKHARAKNVSCHLSRTADELVVRIADDGIGLKGATGDGRGLKYMKQRAELIAATISWLPNNDDGGTVVEIRIARQTLAPAPMIVPAPHPPATVIV